MAISVRTELASFERDLADARGRADRKAELMALNALASTYHDISWLRESILYFRQAVPLAQELEWRWLVRAGLGMLSEMHWKLGEAEQALDCAEKCVEEYRKAGSADKLWAELINVALYCGELGHGDRAVDCCSEAVKLAHDSADIEGECRTLVSLAHAYRGAKRAGRAVAVAYEGLNLARRVAKPDLECEGLFALSRALDALQRYQIAIHTSRQALVLARRLGEPHMQCVALNNEATFRCRLGQHDQALMLFRQQLRIAGESGSAMDQGLAHYGMAHSLKERGETEAAVRRMERAVEAYELVSLRLANRARHYVEEWQQQH